MRRLKPGKLSTRPGRYKSCQLLHQPSAALWVTLGFPLLFLFALDCSQFAGSSLATGFICSSGANSNNTGKHWGGESWNVVYFCFKSNKTLYRCLIYRVQMCAFMIVVKGSSSIQFSHSAASFVCKKRKSDEMRERGRGKRKTQMWGSMNKCPYWLIFCRISQGDCQVILSRWSRPTENHSESKLFRVPFRSLERNKRWEFRIYIHIQPIIENTPHSSSWQPVCGENKRRNNIWYE